MTGLSLLSLRPKNKTEYGKGNERGLQRALLLRDIRGATQVVEIRKGFSAGGTFELELWIGPDLSRSVLSL